MKLTPAKPVLIRSLYVLVVLAELPFLIWNGFIQQVSAEWNDLLVRMRGVQTSPAIDSVVLAAIDDRTAARYGPLPLNRAKLAEGLEVLAEAQPLVLVLAMPGMPPGHMSPGMGTGSGSSGSMTAATMPFYGQGPQTVVPGSEVSDDGVTGWIAWSLSPGITLGLSMARSVPYELTTVRVSLGFDLSRPLARLVGK